MAFDPLLYVALLGGFVAGQLVRWRSRWIERASWGTVGVLVFLLGASLGTVPPAELLSAIPVSFALVTTVIIGTLAVFWLLRWHVPAASTSAPTAVSRLPVAPLLLVALIAGYVTLGRSISDSGQLLEWALYVLLALVGFDLKLSRSALGKLWVPLTAAVVGAIAAAIVGSVALGLSSQASFSTTLAFGWYSLAGPLVGARLGPAIGLIAFLTNFLREDLTMILAPWIGRRLPNGGIAAAGGATSMDTTLAFSAAYDSPGAATLAIGTGIVLTVGASVVLPLLLTLPWP